jgi:hypothetical protein
MSHEKPVEPFSDLHCEEGHVRATLLHDPSVEGLDMAIYVDGSASMKAEYEEQTKVNATFWQSLFGGGTVETLPNKVEPQVQRMLEYLATKDRNGILRVAYWATGPGGRGIEFIGDLTGENVSRYKFLGPNHMGTSTNLAPAMADYIKYLEKQIPQGARRGCAVFVTDGRIQDVEDVEEMSAKIAKRVSQGTLPRTNFILVGVGSAVDEEQMERICHVEYPGVGHLWCHRIAEELGQLAELVAVLVDETMTVAAGGTVYDDRGNILKVYEGRLPAVLEFEVPEGAESFTLEVNGQRYTQPLPEDDDHEEDHH